MHAQAYGGDEGAPNFQLVMTRSPARCRTCRHSARQDICHLARIGWHGPGSTQNVLWPLMIVAEVDEVNPNVYTISFQKSRGLQGLRFAKAAPSQSV